MRSVGIKTGTTWQRAKKTENCRRRKEGLLKIFSEKS
jgi:hypothetical protein